MAVAPNSHMQATPAATHATSEHNRTSHTSTEPTDPPDEHVKQPHPSAPINLPTYTAGTSRKPPPANANSDGDGSLPQQQPRVTLAAQPATAAPHRGGPGG
ncbi:hypothetical protein GCM10010255_61790 [Streptomyces coeruleofuscus]|uniref:Sigma-like protein n=1 Tax=Streptomyces coeruleofuscus TaxID=66879 RepID=A0ABP5W0R5_9ACTN